MAEEKTIGKAARITGYWTEGIIKGLAIAGPPLILLTLALGGTLWIVRNALTFQGKGGID